MYTIAVTWKDPRVAVERIDLPASTTEDEARAAWLSLLEDAYNGGHASTVGLLCDSPRRVVALQEF